MTEERKKGEPGTSTMGGAAGVTRRGRRTRIRRWLDRAERSARSTLGHWGRPVSTITRTSYYLRRRSPVRGNAPVSTGAGDGGAAGTSGARPPASALVGVVVVGRGDQRLLDRASGRPPCE